MRTYIAILLLQAALLCSQNVAAFDPFSTEELIEYGRLDQAQDLSHCARDKIDSTLTLADVVDLTLCNNPQTRALWGSARTQAAQVGVSTAAYLPTLSAIGNVSNNQSQAGSQPQTSSLSQTASLSANYLLYDFGGRSATLENSKQLLIAVNATRNATLQNNFLSAVQAYYALLSARASQM